MNIKRIVSLGLFLGMTYASSVVQPRLAETRQAPAAVGFSQPVAQSSSQVVTQAGVSSSVAPVASGVVTQDQAQAAYNVQQGYLAQLKSLVTGTGITGRNVSELTNFDTLINSATGADSDQQKDFRAGLVGLRAYMDAIASPSSYSSAVLAKIFSLLTNAESRISTANNPTNPWSSGTNKGLNWSVFTNALLPFVGTYPATTANLAQLTQNQAILMAQLDALDRAQPLNNPRRSYVNNWYSGYSNPGVTQTSAVVTVTPANFAGTLTAAVTGVTKAVVSTDPATLAAQENAAELEIKASVDVLFTNAFQSWNKKDFVGAQAQYITALTVLYQLIYKHSDLIKVQPKLGGFIILNCIGGGFNGASYNQNGKYALKTSYLGRGLTGQAYDMFLTFVTQVTSATGLNLFTDAASQGELTPMIKAVTNAKASYGNQVSS